jgi:hypothetical protein
MGILIGPIIRTLAFTHSIVVIMGTGIIPTVIQDITTITTIMVTMVTVAIPEAHTLMAQAINSLRIVQVSLGARQVVLAISTPMLEAARWFAQEIPQWVVRSFVLGGAQCLIQVVAQWSAQEVAQ